MKRICATLLAIALGGLSLTFSHAAPPTVTAVTGLRRAAAGAAGGIVGNGPCTGRAGGQAGLAAPQADPRALIVVDCCAIQPLAASVAR